MNLIGCVKCWKNKGEKKLIKTLRELHKALKIKQTIDIYVRNTNKKYNQNWEADQILDEGTIKLIELNTEGKLRRHGKQHKQIQHWLAQSNKIKQLEEANKQLTEKAKRAESIVSSDNLKDSYIKTLEEFAFFRGSMYKEKRTQAFLEGIGIKYAEYLNADGVEQAFKDRIKWFKSQM